MMKRLVCVAFTRKGAKLCVELTRHFLKLGIQAEGFAPSRIAEEENLCTYGDSLSEWSKRQFAAVDGMIFIGACGIAVRAIAPYVKDKFSDPAVVVLDEQARYAVSLLSGHIGGANDLTEQVAALTGAEPVISTATDRNGIFSVDSWASKQGFWISDRSMAKMVSAALLEGEQIGFLSDFPVVSSLPDGMVTRPKECGICLSLDGQKRPFSHTLTLVPPIVTVGIGCRKDVSCLQVEQQILSELKRRQISMQAIKQLATIDRKAKEPALLAFCGKYGVDFKTYSAEQLRRAEGNFSASPFVLETVGVENVCERAAILASAGTLICPKQANKGVTIALAVQPFEVQFV